VNNKIDRKKRRRLSANALSSSLEPSAMAALVVLFVVH
jgi:hypothetical protein